MQYLIIAVVLVFAAIAGAAVKICFDIPHKKFKNKTLNPPQSCMKHLCRHPRRLRLPTI